MADRTSSVEVDPLLLAGNFAGVGALLDFGSTDITAGWSPSTVNVVLEGDSIAAGLSLVGPMTKATCSNVGVGGSYMGEPGEGGNNVYDRYDSNVKPKRPAADGGSAGTLESWIVLMVGTNQIMWNDLHDGTVAGFSTRMASYISRAKADGFKVAVCTLYARAGFHDSGGPMAYTNAACERSVQYNRWFRSSECDADVIIPFDHAIAGANDPAVSEDKCHLSSVGATRCSQLISVAFQTGAVVQPKFPDAVKGIGYGRDCAA